MDAHVRLERVGECPLAVVRRRAPRQELPKVVRAACGAVWDVLRKQQISGAGRHVSVYLDNQINLEVGVELEKPYFGEGPVIGSHLPTGVAAATTHYGSYGQLDRAHKAIQSWCVDNNVSMAGPCWEIYGHWKEEWNHDPRQISTEVFYLLVPDQALDRLVRKR